MDTPAHGPPASGECRGQYFDGIRDPLAGSSPWHGGVHGVASPCTPAADKDDVGRNTMQKTGSPTRRGRGFLQERLWVVLLPALIVFATATSAWIASDYRGRRHAERLEDHKRNLHALVTGAGPDLGHAIEANLRSAYVQRLDDLARIVHGRAELYHAKGGLLHNANAEHHAEIGAGELGAGEGAILRADASKQQLLVWGPATGAGGRKVGEVRLQTIAPEFPAFPWRLFSMVLATISAAGAAVLMLVTRVLAPLSKLGAVFRRLGQHGPDGAIVPNERFAEFGQLREDILDCVDLLRERQLRAEESFVEVAFSLAREYEWHREGRIGHGQRTRRYSSWLAERLRLPPKERDSLEVAALCHDLGRVPTDDPSLGESGLDAAHPELGAAFFEAMPGLEDVAATIRAHHENFDGSGGPNGLVGEEIPISARILRIADAFERLYSDPAQDLEPEAVLAELEEEKGKSFDPYLFEFFRDEVGIHLLDRKHLKVKLQALQVAQCDEADAQDCIPRA